MRIGWRRQDGIERELRAQRPEARRELVDGIARRMESGRSRSGARTRLGVAAALTAAALGALAATGGLSYAASGVTHAAKAAEHVVAPAKRTAPTVAVGSAQAQYMVAVCFHGHTLRVDSHAAPVLIRLGGTSGSCSGGRFTPPTKSAWMCFAGHNVLVPKSDVGRLGKLGFDRGFCKLGGHSTKPKHVKPKHPKPKKHRK